MVSKFYVEFVSREGKLNSLAKEMTEDAEIFDYEI